MSELKAYPAYSVYNRAATPEESLVYIKSEADKVIAELKESVKSLKESVKSLILDNYLKDKEIRHQKYRRCLANAEACMHKRWRTDDWFDYARSHRHMNKWLELAYKFKEAK